VAEELRDIFSSSPAVNAPWLEDYERQQKYVWQLVDHLVTLALQRPGLLLQRHSEAWCAVNLHSHVIEQLFVASKFDIYGADTQSPSFKSRHVMQGTKNATQKPDGIIRGASADRAQRLLQLHWQRQSQVAAHDEGRLWGVELLVQEPAS
jgi:hypothetical protein